MATALNLPKPKMTLDQFRSQVNSVKAEQKQVVDAFSNPSARLGFGAPHMLEGTQYPLTRLSRNYILMVSLYRSNWIVRKVVDAKAEDMLKNGWELTTQQTPEQLDQYEKVLSDTGTHDKLLDAVKWSRLYGGSGALMLVKGDNDLSKPLIAEDVPLDSYKGLLVFDRWSGISPSAKLNTDITDPNSFGLPESYDVTTSTSMTMNVHHSRILRFTGRTLPRWELQAEQYWGLSEVELMFDELKKRDNTSWNIASLIFRANIFGVKSKDLSQMLSGLGAPGQAAVKFWNTLEAQSQLMSNQGMLILPDDGGLETHQYGFSGISDVYQQFMLDLCGAAEYTMSRLFGRTASGLGQNNEGDEHQYYDHITQLQSQQLEPQLKKLIPVVAMSTWGRIPDDLDWKFLPIRSLTDKDQSELAKSSTDSVMAAYNAGVIGRKTALKELQQQSDVTGLFSNITDDDVAEAENVAGIEATALSQEMEAEVAAPPAEDARKIEDCGPKLTKEEVKFEHPGKGASRCGNCVRYQPDNSCLIVEGFIEPKDWCEEFRKPMKTMDAELDHHSKELRIV